MTHGSLFSGIGGFDFAAEQAGFINIFNCEIDPFCRRVLDYHFPNADNLTDIKITNFKKYEGKIDILSGGFPCQPFSIAGKRKGTDDSRYLWNEMLRAIKEIKPPYVMAENVYGLLNQSNGLVFEQVCSDMEAEGYEIQPFIIPACGVNAPHRRYRVWIIAYNSNARIKNMREWENQIHGNGITADTYGIGSNERGYAGNRIEKEKNVRRLLKQFERLDGLTTAPYATGKRHQERAKHKSIKYLQNDVFASFPTQSPICRRDDGFSEKLDSITFPRWRQEAIKAYGNAIVPGIAYRIFEAIKKTT